MKLTDVVKWNGSGIDLWVGFEFFNYSFYIIIFTFHYFLCLHKVLERKGSLNNSVLWSNHLICKERIWIGDFQQIFQNIYFQDSLPEKSGFQMFYEENQFGAFCFSAIRDIFRLNISNNGVMNNFWQFNDQIFFLPHKCWFIFSSTIIYLITNTEVYISITNGKNINILFRLKC